MLPVNHTFFSTELIPSLQYLVYEGHYGKQQVYRVGPASSCQVVNAMGQVSSAACEEALPVLCSQSSPYAASATSANELTVTAGDLAITGCVQRTRLR